MPKQPVEDLTNQWIYEEFYHSNSKPLSINVIIKYIKALLDIAGADGVLTDAERKWVLGYAAARGIKQEDVDGLKEYKIGSENATSDFNNKNQLKLAENFQLELIYDGFRAASADGPLKPREIDGISGVAKHLGISDEKFQSILDLYKQEQELKQKRIALIFPKTYGEAIKQIDTHYER